MKTKIFAAAIAVIFSTAPGFALDGGNGDFFQSVKAPVASSSSGIIIVPTRGDVQPDPLKRVFDTSDKN